MELVHKYAENHILVKCSVANLMTANVKKWKYNRPPDIIRCNEIAQFIHNRRPAIDWLFYVICETSTNCLYLLDGLHRFTSLKIIYNENRKLPGDISNILSQCVLLSVRIDPTDGEAIDVFQQINKSNPVPELYLQNADQEKKTIIEEIAAKWMAEFRPHFSSNPKPNVPNTNRDRFIELLDSIYENMKMTRETGHELDLKLREMNEHMKTNPPPKLSAKTLEKCQQSGCYLFIVKPDVLQSMFD